MRLYEFVSVDEQQLDEINARKAMAAGALALATGIGSPNLPEPKNNRAQIIEPAAVSKTPQEIHPPEIAHKAKPKTASKPSDFKKLVDTVVNKYKIDLDLAIEIVTLAKRYEKPSFPRAEDLLAIIGIESGFNPNAVSGLKNDPAVGLTQIRPNVWGLDAADLQGDMERQISTSSDILSKYNKHLRNSEDAVHAYNVGLTAFQRVDHNPAYVAKFNNEKGLY